MYRKRVAQSLLLGILFILVVFLLLRMSTLAGGLFTDSGQMLGGDTTYDVELADLDGDGDQDAFAANSLSNRIWVNQGGLQGGTIGIFSNSGQSPGIQTSQGVALGDLNDDPYIDAFVANNGANEVWLNNAAGLFSNSGQSLSPGSNSQDVALGYLDNDAYLDAFVANNGGNEVWVNGGTAVFTVTQQNMGTSNSHEVVLGDVDGDTELDAYVANGSAGSQPDELWLGNGDGTFTASGQSLDTDWNEGAALGDLDGDGDLDLFLAAWFGNDAVWINQGGAQGGSLGTFNDSGQSLSGNGSMDVALVDVNNDTYLDAIVAKWLVPNEIWLNDGNGQFTDSGQTLDDAATYEVAVGDLDNDSDVDLFFGNTGVNHVWVAGGLGLPIAWFDVDARMNPLGNQVYPWAQTGNAVLPILLSYAAPEALSVQAQITSTTGTMIETVSFNPGELSNPLTVTNPQPTVSETVTITLDVEAAGAAAVQSVNMVSSPLHLTFVNQDQGPTSCWLCMIDWLLKLLGFEPSFWQLHHVEFTSLENSLTWDYYTVLFGQYSSELETILLTNPTLLWDANNTIQVWSDDIVAADQGMGGETIIDQAMVDEARDLFEGIRDEASPEMAARIQFEMDVIDFDSYVGLDMDQALARIEERVQGQVYLPVVTRSD